MQMKRMLCMVLCCVLLVGVISLSANASEVKRLIWNFLLIIL